FSPEFLNLTGGGFKQVGIGTGDKATCTSENPYPVGPNSGCYTSCTDLGLVVNDYYDSNFPILYHSCSQSTSHGPYDPFFEFTGSDFKLQNAREAPYCLYSQSPDLTTAANFFPPSGNCFGYSANEWMTFQVHVKIGPKVGDEFKDSYIDLWT